MYHSGVSVDHGPEETVTGRRAGLTATTPETVFVLYSLEAILCTLLIFSLLWALYRNRQLGRGSNLLVLLAALAMTSAAFVVASALSLYEFWFQARLAPGDPESLASPALALAALFFVLFSTLDPGDDASRRGLGAGGLLAVGAAAFYVGVLQGWIWLGPSLCFALAFIAAVCKPGPTKAPRLMALSLGLFLAGCLARPTLQWTGVAIGEWRVSVGQHVPFLLALVLLARVVETDLGALFIKFFLRLNLTFIALAGFIILLMARQQRQEYLDFAVQQTTRLTEQLQGHILHFRGRGMSAEDILHSPEVTKQIVANFGTLADMREVSIYLDNRWLRLTIDSEGLIERRTGVQSPLRSFPDQPILDGERLVLPTSLTDRDALIGGVEIRESVLEMNRAIAGNVMWIFLAFTLAVAGSGVLIGIIVTQADSTIQRQYRRLRQTDRRMAQVAKMAALGEMAGGVAHEINNPLGVILGRADLLIATSGRGQASDSLEDLKVIRRQAERAGKITADLLDFARPHPLDLRRHDIDRIVQDTTRFLKPMIEGEGIALETELRAGISLSVDPDRIRQVLVNLIQNAIEACRDKRGATIRVATNRRRDNGCVEISVKDNGSGISADALERIFDPFFTTKPQGTGLGLSVSYGIVKQHGGSIEIFSELDKGACFVAVLPVDIEVANRRGGEGGQPPDSSENALGI